MNHALLPGPGDLLPIYAGHPHDPRTPEDDVDDATAESLTEIREWLAIAEIANSNGDFRKRRQALEEVQAMLEEVLS
jgi:hypothetical protein